MNLFLYSKSDAEKQTLHKITERVCEQLKIAYAELMRKNGWTLSDQKFQIDGVTYLWTDVDKDDEMIRDNVRRITIDKNNYLSGFTNYFHAAIDMSIHYPSDPELRVEYLALDLQQVKTLQKLCLTNAGPEPIQIPKSVTHLTLRSCDIDVIEWDANLQVIRIEGADFKGLENVKKTLQRKPVAKQIWVDHQVNVTEMGEFNEITTAVNGKTMYFIKEPHGIGGSDWETIRFVLNGSKQTPTYSIKHLFINGNKLERSDLDSIEPTIKDIKIDSLKVTTMNDEYYKSHLKEHALEFANVPDAKSAGVDPKTLHTTTEVSCISSIKPQADDDFYFNQALKFLAVKHTDYKFFEKNRQWVEYLVIEIPELLTTDKITEFFNYCRQYKFVKIISPLGAMRQRFNQLSLSEGAQISNKFMDVLNGGDRTEVIYKVNENMDDGGFAISTEHTTYRFEFLGGFDFLHTRNDNGKRAFSTFREKFVDKVGELMYMKRIELCGKLGPLFDYIASAEKRTSNAFKYLGALAHIRIESDRIVSTNFAFLLKCLPSVKYFTVIHPPAMILSNSSYDELISTFKNKSYWTQLTYLGNRLTNQFVFANPKSTDPTNAEIAELAEQPSLAKQFEEIIKSKRPDSFSGMLVNAI